MNNFLTNIAVILVVILGALFAIPLMVNWDNYRADFEHRFSEILGAKVELDGRLNVRLLPAPYLYAENLRIGDSGISGKPLLDVKAMTLWVAVPPLLKGIVEASQLTLERPKVLLPFNKAGRPIWTTKKYDTTKRSKRVRTSDKLFALMKLSPKLISLKVVSIKNGEVAIDIKTKGGGKKSRHVQFKGLQGVLSASTLNGPFYFNGKYQAEENGRFIRLVVGAKDKNSQYPVKAKLTLPDRSYKFELDGRFSGLNKNNPRLDGKLIGNLGVISSGLSNQYAGLNNDKVSDLNAPVQQLDGDDIKLSSKVALTTREARFDDVMLQAGSLARPQRVGGRAVIGWSSGLSLTGKADARLLDLNLIYGKGNPSKIGPFSVLQRMRKLATERAKQFDKINFSANADQIIVGEGSVKKFKLNVASVNGAIKVRDLAGDLPGSGRVTIKGAFSDKRNPSLFQGQILLRGLEFRQFLRWVNPSYQAKSDIGRGKFILAGELKLSERNIAVSDVQGDIGGTKLRASLNYKDKARYGVKVGKGIEQGEEIKLSLFADQFNADSLIGKPVRSSQIIEEFETWFADNHGQAQKSVDADFLIELAAGKIILQDSEPDDVRLIWRRNRKGSGVQLIEGGTGKDLKIQYQSDGTFKGGKARYLIEAKTVDALSELFKWSNLTEKFDIEQRIAARFLPLRLAVERQSLADTTHYRFDGVMAGSEVAFSVLAPTDKTSKTPSKVTIFGGMEQQDGAELLAQFLPLEFSPFVKNASVGPAKMTFSAHGDANKGFDGEIGIFNKVMQATYQGKLSIQNKKVTGDGVFQLEGTDATAVLGLFGLSQSESEVVPIKAKASFEAQEDGLAINDLKIGIGDKRIYGTGKLAEGESQASSGKKIALAMDVVEVSSLLGVLLDASENSKKSTVNDGGDKRKEKDINLWPARSFSLESGKLKQTPVGHFSITSKELILGDHLSLSKARLEWRSYENRIEIIKLQGQALGGQFNASGELRRTEVGYSLNGLVELKGGQLEEVGAASEASLGAGRFDVNLKLSGSGASPRALVASLVGEGFVKISDGVLRQISPADVGKVADQFMSSVGEDTEGLRIALEAKIEDQAQVAIGSLDIGLQLLNGVVSLRLADFGVKPGTLGLNGKLDLQDLSFMGDWLIRAQATKKSGALPAVYRRVKGTLNSTLPFKSELEITDLERHLTLRRKEREIETLEIKRSLEKEQRLREKRKQAQKELQRLELEKQLLQDELNRTELPDLAP